MSAVDAFDLFTALVVLATWAVSDYWHRRHRLPY